MQFAKVDGEGDPNTAPAYRSAVEWLYGVSYAAKFAAKAALGKDYVVPPLEGGEVMPNKGMAFNGPHHEIYLSDPRKTESIKLNTILRQPVKFMT
jgi:hypothetical protein